MDENSIDEFQGKFRFLSNFWLCDIRYKNKIYRSVEHAYQELKFEDEEIRKKIASQVTPGDAKRTARQYKGKIRRDWIQIRVDVMKELVFCKFIQNRLLREKLIDTGDRKLIEGNTWNDTFWGVDLRTMKGNNILGEILEDIRREIRNYDLKIFRDLSTECEFFEIILPSNVNKGFICNHSDCSIIEKDEILGMELGVCKSNVCPLASPLNPKDSCESRFFIGFGYTPEDFENKGDEDTLMIIWE